MRTRSFRLAAWSLPAIFVLVTALQLVLVSRNGTALGIDGAMATAGSLGMVVVGALIVTRYPKNAIGWILAAIPIAMAVQIASNEYAIYGHVTAVDAAPYHLEAFAVLGGLWTALGLLTFIFLLFPTGKLPSPRWRWVAWIAGINQVLLMAAMPFTDATFGNDGPLANAPNPLHVAGGPGGGPERSL